MFCHRFVCRDDAERSLPVRRADDVLLLRAAPGEVQGRPVATRGAVVLQPHARKAGIGTRRCYNRHVAVLRSARAGDDHC
jgi:hypothetical protein